MCALVTVVQTCALPICSFRLEDVGDERRAVLAEALNLGSVGDGVIQGAGVRLVLRDGAEADEVRGLADRVGARLAAVPARFEDAFIDLLGGGPGGTSALAERMPSVHLDSDIAVSCRDLPQPIGRASCRERGFQYV